MTYKICHISTVHSSADVRIFQKECVTLANEGYDVYFIVTSDKSYVNSKVNIIQLSKKNNRMYRMFIKTMEALFKALKVNADLYHFHDPELIIVGIFLKIFGKKVVYDVHEDVPSQILAKDWIKIKFLRKIISGMFNIFEKSISKLFDGIISVTPEILEKFKVRKKALLRNYPIVNMIEKSLPVSRKGKKYVVIYAGGLMKIRGIKEIVDSVAYFNGEVEFWLLGKWDSSDYKTECEKSDGWKYTKYIGFKPLNEVYSYMKAADIGICTLYPVKNYLKSLPIKAFEYMACGMPILMSDFPYWREKFQDAAEFVDPQDPKEIYKKIKYLMENKQVMKEIGKNGIERVKKYYSWDDEKKELLKLYDNILGIEGKYMED